MQKILNEVLLGPTCQVLLVAFGDLRLSWVYSHKFSQTMLVRFIWSAN